MDRQRVRKTSPAFHILATNSPQGQLVNHDICDQGVVFISCLATIKCLSAIFDRDSMMTTVYRNPMTVYGGLR